MSVHHSSKRKVLFFRLSLFYIFKSNILWFHLYVLKKLMLSYKSNIICGMTFNTVSTSSDLGICMLPSLRFEIVFILFSLLFYFMFYLILKFFFF